MINLPNISDPNHYLSKAQKEFPWYFSGFESTVNALIPLLSEKEFRALLNDKLQFSQNFNEKAFIQIACEVSVTASLAQRFPEGFIYEKKVSPPKNVDCYFKIGDLGFNVEVKCPNFDAQEKIDKKKGIKIVTAGRIPNHQKEIQDLMNLLNDGLKKAGRGDEETHLQKSMDNTLKDFLTSASQKFPSNNVGSDFNLLVVCCSDVSNVQDFYNSLFGNEGLFTKDSFHDPRAYSNVDLVMFTNLYHRHHLFFDKPHINNNWELFGAFNLFQVNPHIPTGKHHANVTLVNSIPNYSIELLNFSDASKQMGSIETFVRVHHFVKENLEKRGINLF